MAGPGDDTAGAGGRGHLRASHGDREQAIEVLKDAFVQNRLSKDELDARVAQAFTSRTHAELAAVTADLPAGQAVARPRTPAREQDGLTMKQAVAWSACMVIPTAIATAMAIGWAVAVRTDSAGKAVMVPFLAFFVATVVAGTMISVARDNSKRSRGQLPPGPALDAGGQAGGQAFRGTGSAAEAEQFPWIDHGQQHAAEAVPSGVPRPRLHGARLPRQRGAGGRGYAIGYAAQ